MEPTTPHVHFLTKQRQGRSVGWYAPAELPATAPQDGRHVVPLRPSGDFHPVYTCEIIEYQGPGQQGPPIAYEMVHRKGHQFLLRIHSTTLHFRERLSGSQRHPLKYLGQLAHPDFGSKFVEIEPKEQEALEELLERQNLIVIGCAPYTHYGGLNGKD